jgi:hypothetical protein
MQTYHDADVAQEVAAGDDDDVNGVAAGDDDDVDGVAAGDDVDGVAAGVDDDVVDGVAAGDDDVDGEESATVMEEGSGIALSYTSVELSASHIPPSRLFASADLLRAGARSHLQ